MFVPTIVDAVIENTDIAIICTNCMIYYHKPSDEYALMRETLKRVSVEEMSVSNNTLYISVNDYESRSKLEYLYRRASKKVLYTPFYQDNKPA